MSRMPARLGALTLSTALVLAAVPATAHVTVSSPDAAQEGYGKLVFRVPNESDTAATDKLTITLPEDTPFAHLTAGTKPGWDVEIETAELPEPVENGDVILTEAPRTVTWTATGDGIAPGEFDEFSLSGGPFPAAEEISFGAAQAYDDGEVVDWAEEATGDEEPEKPAPLLPLAPAGEDGHGDGAEGVDQAAAETEDSSDTLARGLGLAAVLLAAGALVAALRQNRRRA
ncbi:YcnI family protein [Aeromicrobium sp. CTD01-1L150]|uniref:YcnI family copper-binding membrane protein n=1 Tax=Aeromicrobium sp. CTD01-1L150 TaxID=3341830 RepID=UPI0035BEB69E